MAVPSGQGTGFKPRPTTTKLMLLGPLSKALDTRSISKTVPLLLEVALDKNVSFIYANVYL